MDEDKNTVDTQTNGNGAKPAAAGDAQADEAAPCAPENAQDKGDVDPVAVLEAENAELKDKLLRAVADLENYRRRAEREKAEASLYAASNFARELLSVADNLQRALASIDEDGRKSLDEASSSLLAGVEMTERELLNVFQRHNIKRIDPLGEKFDPNLHQAMFEIEDDKAEPSTILQVMQPGYVIGERVLRPAMVGVAKQPKSEKTG